MSRKELLERLRATRRLSLELARPLRPEDYRIQSMPDVSPPWWNLGHTTWFFAKNVLEPRGLYRPADARLEYVLNSYYEALGPRVPRVERGLQTRPTTDEIFAFRERTDERLERVVEETPEGEWERTAFLIETGIHHEQQHQELFVTEIKHILGSNALELREPYRAARAATTAAATRDAAAGTGEVPACCAGASRGTGLGELETAEEAVASTSRPTRAAPAIATGHRAGASSTTGADAVTDHVAGAGPAAAGPAPLAQLELDGGLDWFGNREGGWCFDNELAVHRAWLDPFALSTRLVTNREYLEFVEAGGYRDPLLWLANGWAAIQAQGITAPLYWEEVGGRWMYWTLAGMQPLRLDEPVCHVSFYEADAYARWLGRERSEWQGARLPTEREWEHAARHLGFAVDEGNFLEDWALQPRPARNGGWSQAAGDVWEWTSSHYEAYPGYVPFDGNLTEYNGKFMDNQRVLRGGSCATPRDHIRVSYRNFWAPDTRFQFAGIRLARTLGAAAGSERP